MSTPNNNYELFNFTDPIEEAFQSVIEAVIPDLDVQLSRGTTVSKDISCDIRFTDGAATGHVYRVEMGDEPVETHSVYDLFEGGLVEIELRRVRYDAETVADNEPDSDQPDTTSRDVLSLLAGRVRFALRRTDAAALNAALLSPKISHIRPLPGSRFIDEELFQDVMVLRYQINYGIPSTIWPSVILTESGYYIETEDGERLEWE